MRPEQTREASRHESTDPQRAGALPLRVFFPRHTEDDGAGPGGGRNLRQRPPAPGKMPSKPPRCCLCPKTTVQKKNANRSGRRPAKRRAGPSLPAVDGSMRKRACRRAPRRFSSGHRPPRPADVFTSSARILRPSRPLISKPLLHSRLSPGRRSSASGSGPKIQGGALPFPRLSRADRHSRPLDSSPPCKASLPESPGHPPPETKNPRAESPPTGIISTLIEVRTDRTHGPAQTPHQDQAEASLLLCNTLSSSRKITSSAPLTSRQIQGLELTKPATR